MASITGVGSGYYNYYHVKGRYDDGKVRTPWYDRDLSKEEICSSNDVPDRNYAGADLCRKLADTYRSVAASNRAKYATAQEATDAIYAKYNQKAYSGYSLEERFAMARNEVSMTLYGTIQLGNVWNDPHLDGEVSLNTRSGANEAENRAYNIKTLGAQFMNLWRNNGIDASQMSGSSFMFSVNGMDMSAAITLLDGKKHDDSFLEMMTAALNSKSNAKNLFYNLLYDSDKSTLPKDSLAKFRLYSDFKNITGLDLREFSQTDDGFFDSEGRNATDIYDEALNSTDKVSFQFRGIASNYFRTLVDDALKYDMDSTPDLTLSMEYRDGNVYLNGDKPHLDFSA